MAVKIRISVMPLTCNWVKSTAPPMSVKPSLMASMPTKIKPMPINARPNALPVSPKKLANTPKNSKGRATTLKLMFCPAKASSQMPLVAPKLVPNNTAMPAPKPIKPALKNAIVSSDTKVLDCNTNVAPMPNSKPLNGVSVDLFSKRSK